MRIPPALTPGQDTALRLDTADRAAKGLTKNQISMLRASGDKHGLVREWFGGALRTRLTLEARGLLTHVNTRNCDGRGSVRFEPTPTGRVVLASLAQ